jgi:hypothetical protein
MRSIEQAEIQSAYSGATLVYGRDEALKLLGDPDPPGHAAVASFATNGKRTGFYTHFSAPSEKEGKVEYHQHRLCSTLFVGSFEDFERGRRQLRNMQEDAKHESCALKDRPVAYWEVRQCAAPSIRRATIADGPYVALRESETTVPSRGRGSSPGAEDDNGDGLEEPSPPAETPRSRKPMASRANLGGDNLKERPKPTKHLPRKRKASLVVLRNGDGEDASPPTKTLRYKHESSLGDLRGADGGNGSGSIDGPAHAPAPLRRSKRIL